MSTITSTVVHIPGRDARTLDGMDISKDDAARQFDSAFQTASMDAREEVVGNVRNIYFTRRTGTKGANSTVVHIPGRDPRTLDGMDLSKEDAARQFDSAFQTASMDAREEEVDGVRHIYFTRRTGTKG